MSHEFMCKWVKLPKKGYQSRKTVFLEGWGVCVFWGGLVMEHYPVFFHLPLTSDDLLSRSSKKKKKTET